MAADSSDAAEVDKLYEFGERLNESKDKSQVRTKTLFLAFRVCCGRGFKRLILVQNVSDYKGIIMAVKGGSVKAKQLAAQLIPRFFKFFPSLAIEAMTALFDLVEEDELGVNLFAIVSLYLVSRVLSCIC